jgi:hypothetical protein
MLIRQIVLEPEAGVTHSKLHASHSASEPVRVFLWVGIRKRRRLPRCCLRRGVLKLLDGDSYWNLDTRFGAGNGEQLKLLLALIR